MSGGGGDHANYTVLQIALYCNALRHRYLIHIASYPLTGDKPQLALPRLAFVFRALGMGAMLPSR